MVLPEETGLTARLTGRHSQRPWSSGSGLGTNVKACPHGRCPVLQSRNQTSVSGHSGRLHERCPKTPHENYLSQMSGPTLKVTPPHARLKSLIIKMPMMPSSTDHEAQNLGHRMQGKVPSGADIAEESTIGLT